MLLYKNRLKNAERREFQFKTVVVPYFFESMLQSFVEICKHFKTFILEESGAMDHELTRHELLLLAEVVILYQSINELLT